MRIGRLTLEIYLFAIVAVLAAVAMVVATAVTLQSEHRRDMTLASGHIVRTFWLDHKDAKTIREVRTRPLEGSGPLVTLYDSEARLMASSASPPLPMPAHPELLELREKSFAAVGHGLIAHEVRNEGRVVAIGIVKFGGIPSLRRLAWSVLALLLTLLAGALTFARRLARPLQHVTRVAQRFGEGDLAARVGKQRNDEIGAVGRAFDAMADRVAGLMAAQQELMANVSHELGTPLARIQVAVDLITDGKSEKVKELMPHIAQDIAELERLIDDVMIVAKLDLSRSAGPAVFPLRLEVSPVSSLLEEAACRFRSQHPTRKLAVDFASALPHLSVDPVLLRRVVDNLLENARKFSDRDTTIQLFAHAARGHVMISVADNGIGIDESDLQKVFMPFFRSDKSRSRSTGGVGLGLALARRVVEAHGGTIGIASAMGCGTTVTVELPTVIPATSLRPQG
jgi:signal transduction histidine kinase